MGLDDGLNKLLLGQYHEALAAFDGLKPAPRAAKLRKLTADLTELAAYVTELTKGNLSAPEPGPDNRFTMDLPQLHFKLKRLSRQLLMAAAGYKITPIDYLGELSEPLEHLMTLALAEERQNESRRDQDPDTGLLNRKAFMRGVYDLIQRQPNQVGILFCCRLDNIKYINNTHGYGAGDLYIARVVEILTGCESGGILRARLGGNEFAVYAHGFDNEDDAFRFARDHLDALSKTVIELPGARMKIRVSGGVAIYPHDASESDVLINYASHAMFEVKNLNRGTVMRFNPEVYQRKASLLDHQEKLEELLETRAIGFVFQPIVCLREARVTAYEALMRSKMAEFKSPLDLLSLAEAQSKLGQLERLTFEMIFDWIHQNLEQLGDRKIFFNTISVRYLDIAELSRIHPQYQRIVGNMVFEILETAAVENLLLERVGALRRELSALVAIDDFGCGHSNAMRLINMSPDILKIDRFFISNIHSAPTAKRELLANILNYCRAKGILTLAEGVESYEELADIIGMGFDYVQGFYPGRPEWALQSLDPRIREEILGLTAKSA